MHSNLSERWSDIEDMLDEALDLSRDERAAFLSRRCGGDAFLRAYVERLLDADGAGPTFLDGEAADFALPMLPDVPSSQGASAAVDRIGPYRIVGVLGHGGMGTVYLAERSDGQFEQRVAIKVLSSGAEGSPGMRASASPGSPGERIVRRFLAERQILAALDHPGIARLLDGGVTEEGHPYFALEFVDGMPIDAYCDEWRLPIRDRLELFRAVCEAVQYAHQRLVVHRDLKPANILVSDDGRVKLLDFGIAKLLENDEDSRTLMLTETGVRWMTPRYAAPEQVRGEPVTTATDVYQLGVILYELLSGHRPYRLARQSTYEIERAVCEQHPESPSAVVRRTVALGGSDGEPTRITPADVSFARRTDARRLRRGLSGDLDAIVLKALRKQPATRYPSAAALADDLGRFLERRPVSAHAGSSAYRLRRFVRRHRAGVVSAATAIVAVVGLSAVYAHQLARSAEDARAEARKADQTVQFLISLFDQADPANWKLNQNIDAALLVLEPAAARVEDLAREPDVHARLLYTLGRIYAGLGRPDRAEVLLSDALAIRRRLHEHPHEDVAATLLQYALVIALRDPERSVPVFREASGMRRAIHRGDHAELAWSLLQWARYLPFESPEKDRLRGEAFGMIRRLHGPRSAEMASALHEYYVLGLGSQDRDEVREAFDEVLAIEREQFGDADTRTAVTLHNIGLMTDAEGRHEEGLVLLRESLEVNRRALGRDHPQVSQMALNVAATLHEHGRFDEADSMLSEVVASYRTMLPDSSRRISYALSWYGRNLLALGLPARAEAVLREAQAIEGLVAPDRLPCSRSQRWLAQSLIDQGNLNEADALLTESQSRCQDVWGHEDPARREVLQNLVRLNESQGRAAEAAAHRHALANLTP